MEFFKASPDAIEKHFETNLTQGLTKQEAQKRFKDVGPNRVPYKAPDSYIKIFFQQFKSPLIYVLLAAAAIIYFVDSKTDALFISFVLLLNAFVGTYQEGKSGNILSSLQKFLRTYCVVVRDGEREIVSSENIVPGDLVVLDEGDQVPADCRVIESTNLHVNQASMTGEAQPVQKNADALEAAGDVQTFEQHNMLFSGSFVTQGTAHAVVVATGISTQTGKLHKMVEEIDTSIPLKVEIEKIAYVVLWIVLAICAALFVIGFYTGRPVKELLTILTALFICVVPEGLPVIFTLVLAMGVGRMAQKMVLVKRLQAVEGLGQVDVTLLDKTGTLTRGEVGVQKIFIDLHTHAVLEVEKTHEHTSLSLLAHTAAIMSGAQVETTTAQGRVVPVHAKGDQTEVALTTFARQFKVEKPELLKGFNYFKEQPFDYESKLKVAYIKTQSFAGIPLPSDATLMLVTGAPEVVWERCTEVFGDGAAHKITPDNAHTITTALHDMLGDGMRVVAAAYRIVQGEGDVSSLTFTGMYGLSDTLREGVRKVVEHARESGLHIAMLTGDHEETAKSIAKQCGIFTAGDSVLSGEKLQAMLEQGGIPGTETTVFARVTPENKLAIVQRYRAAGHIVAMTGDGVNDAASIAAADIGIAMGRIGTEVAKEAADVIILDDRFESIIEALEEGRHIFYTLKRVILYFFSTNMAEILVILFAITLGFALPLNAIQILFINLVTDGFLNMSLALEPKEQEVLGQPNRRGERIIDGAMLGSMMFMAVPMALGCLYLFVFYYDTGLLKARTMALISMSLFQLFNAWNCRSSRLSVFSMSLFSNKALVLASVLVFLFQFAIVYIPPLQSLFRTQALNATDWLSAIAISSSIVLLEELRKIYKRRV